MSASHPKSASAATPATYRDAGVDIDAGDALVERIKPFARRTMRPEVLAGIGGFGALCAVPARYREPVLVSGTDGVGTKLKLAFAWDMHDGVGQDLVAMSVNDVLVQGAEPLFFLDYFACGRLDVQVAERVVRGIASGCELAGCALIGGETAEMPDMYPPGEYDLAGFAVGVVERAAVLDGSRIQAGDVLLGLASSGVHSNGYSLVRHLLKSHTPPARLDGMDWRERLMLPTRIYARALLPLLLPQITATTTTTATTTATPATPTPGKLKGLAHITGGGLTENVPRILPHGLQARITPTRWPLPEVFDWLKQAGRMEVAEFMRTFNAGIGMVAVVAATDAEAVANDLLRSGETVYVIGDIATSPEGSDAPPKVVYA